MPTVWFLLVAVMLTAYVVLDGFDLGVGVLHLLVARSEEERRLLIRTVGPVWDGNEVWLLAGGGTLFFAFPRLYASGFSGFYLPLMIVLWLLIGRGVSIELRMHADSPVWRGLFNGAFGISSLLLAVFYGAALGNVLRGVPLGRDGYFFLPLWTNWNVGASPGVLDWYTVLSGVLVLVALAMHGAHYAALKTLGEVNRRARRAAAVLWPVLVALTAASLAASLFVRPGLADNYRRAPVLYAIPALVAVSLAAIWHFGRTGNEGAAFRASCAYLVLMMAGAAAAVYPNLLLSSTDPGLNITVENAHASEYSLRVGLIWWSFGMLLAVAYFVFVYRMFRGKIAEDGDHGHGY
ncbi:MAG TPA: cytochrome d ubiquinol oxidase subunit II [Bryobacteraceae bacterium]|jgi:cytochrome d ubiquinol oxidase subunit II|nr:cytochrome d ubiquinol oxidase subunit II [Bryobacteraceae bacterium]